MRHLGAARIEQTLFSIDQVLSVSAALLLAFLLIRRAVVASGDPLIAAPSRPNRIREDALALVVLIYLLAASGTHLLLQGFAGPDDSVRQNLLIGGAAQSAGIAACLFMGATRFPGGIRQFWHASGATRWARAGALVAAMTLIAVGICPIVRDVSAALILYFEPGYEFAQHPTIHALHEAAQPWGLVLALWASALVLAPLAEELFFRGLLQTFLIDVFSSRWKAIGVSAAAFAAVHFQQLHAVPALAVLAVFIGYAYERTGSLMVPILIHSLFNLKTLVWESLATHAAA